MEELAAAAVPPPRWHRERRHRRKASDAAANALAASFGDVFGGPPRFATGAPADYAEVFGGVAASCSIPYLDVPPAAAARDAGAGAGGYGDIFGRFDFGDFATPYDEMLAGPEEIPSPSGSSRSSIRKESGQLDSERSIPYQNYPNAGCDQHFDEEDFYQVSFPPNGEQKFSMSYNKTRGRPDDLVEMTTCIVEPSISYVVDSCNLSNDSEMNLVMDSGTHANGVKGKVRPPIPASSSIKSANSDSVLDSCSLSDDSEMNHVPVMDSGTLGDGVKGKVSPPFPASSSMRSANSASVVDQQQHIPTCLPISENICEDENYNKRSSTHSVSSEETPSPNYPFLRVSNTSLPAAPIKVQPPPMPPSKLLNKKGSNKNGHSDANPNSAAAAAAMKEAMEFAEARLKAAKEMMDRKGDSFKLRKRPVHHRSTKSTEIKEIKTPDEVHLFEEKLNMRRLLEEENQNKDPALLDNSDGSAVKFVDCDHNKKGVLPPGKPQEMLQNGNKLEQLRKCTSDAGFYELISHDQRCRPNAVTCKGSKDGTTNSFTKLNQFEKEKAGGFAGELKRFRKLWFSNDTTELRTECVNLVKDGIASVEVEHKAPRPPEVPSCEETATYQELTDSRFKHCPGVGISLQAHDDDGRFEISCMNNIPAKVHVVPEMCSPYLEACISGGHADDNKNHSVASTEETPLVRKSNQDNNNKEELELPCADEILCTSARSQISREHPILLNIDETNETQVKISELEEYAESRETSEEGKLFSFVDVAYLHSENERANEVTSEALIHEEMKKFGTEETAGAHEDFQYGDVDADADAGSSEKEVNVTSGSANANGNKNDEAEVLNVFVGDAEPNVRTCGTFGKDPYQLQESQGSLGPQDLENIMYRVEDIASHGMERKTKESLLENVEKTLVEEVLNHVGREGKKSIEAGIHKRQNNIYAEVNIRCDRDGNTCHSISEVFTDDGSDYAVKMSTRLDNLASSFSEACTSMRQLSQNAVSASAEKADKITPVLENLEEDCREADREFRNEKCTALEERQKAASKMEERDDKDSILNVRFKDQKSFYMDSDIIPRFVEDTASDIVQKSREENPIVQRTKGKNDIKKTEGETEEMLVRQDEDKEKECKMEKQKEQNKERWRRELEEEKEREMERAKDRLAVQRATREAHERAFAEARVKAKRIAHERAFARQRADAESHEKEEKTTAEAPAEKANREARMKAERAAVERATAEARERAIEKAKAASDAKERMERFRSSFKDSFKVTNQDNQQETQFQKSAFNNCGKSMGSCNEVEVESALRHKAKLERQQRTAERAAKALAEKNMRDMLAQREQAERHRLAEFLDPEVKRWSNGKEGNLRALLSTLQYILGSDSGWQSVPLTDLITTTGVKKAYRKATLCVHPDKLQQRGATIRRKYICEKVFDLLKEAWNKFDSEER
ncbi:uncharacterized protein LOC133916442 isoform X2 [Phragmites australis]|uniref:uncharacterized protein LOC133916442 isoform X2 n=1 Tax=Phragmites australis TaxID=29695 RepID=UPI002D76BEFA|nr:uncharacterized protein LOC133916442 isoform X2 [Phragmites australis]